MKVPVTVGTVDEYVEDDDSVMGDDDITARVIWSYVTW